MDMHTMDDVRYNGSRLWAMKSYLELDRINGAVVGISPPLSYCKTNGYSKP
jgi:hypothetical protein